ncbi:protein dehydratase [Microvirga brassicacearum]|uniref:Protein dehydratase n=2 Tax=Microvirga brassicacearum TaxID=2580413 RepID=A0A5N3P5N6_9HYPH|nr:MaoC family dehydratase N-terminal domain-containing protein [Microvirga brassicacearum]KAB0265013.1 protein dehydratase [Microvirga brassicacearum]
MASAQFDLDHLRRWIGKTEQASDVVTARLVVGLIATIGSGSRDDLEVPIAMHWCLAPPMVPMSELGSDGHPARGGFLPPIPLPRRMWAGGRLDIHDRLRVSDVVTRHSEIRDVTVKRGSSGTLCFVTVDHEISTERGVAISERQDIVYRPGETGRLAAPSAVSTSPAQPRPARWSGSVAADPVLLFRYSALTFNGHRIHYDRCYCRDVEGYPGLIVHGPLQATMLLEFAASLKGGRTPRAFDFRGVKPLFDGADFTLNAVEDGGALRLWTANADGHATMEASATW